MLKKRSSIWGVLAMLVVLSPGVHADSSPMIQLDPPSASVDLPPGTAPEPGATGPSGANGSDGAVATEPAATGCGPFDPDCRRRLLRILTGVQIAPIQLEGGVRIGESGPNGVVRFGVNVGAVDVAMGDVRLLPFEAVYLPNEGGFRVRVSLVDSDVMFFCKDEDNSTVAPGVGLIKAMVGLPPNCRPDGFLGIGGTIANVNVDTATSRVAARWAEINLVLDMFRNANGMDYLKKHLNAYLGASVDTVWPGSTPGASSGADTMLRLNMGISGMVRSDDNHWEIRGFAGYRPNAINWSDYAIELKTEILYHFLFNRSLMGTVGLDANYDHWSVPGHSIDSFASDRDRDSFYIGLMFGLTWRGFN